MRVSAIPFKKIFSFLILILGIVLLVAVTNNENFFKQHPLGMFAEYPNRSTASPKGFIGALPIPGQLANQIFRFLSVYGIARSLNRTPVYFMDYSDSMLEYRFGEMMKDFSTIFPNLLESAKFMNPPRSQMKKVKFGSSWCCLYENPERLQNITDEYVQINHYYMFSYKYFIEYKMEIDNFLQFSESVEEEGPKAAEMMKLPEDVEKNPVLCVHIRRKDFRESHMEPTREEFAIPAIRYLLKKIGGSTENNTVLLLLGDDQNYMDLLAQNKNATQSNYFQNEIIRSNNSKGVDFWLAAYKCHTFLSTASTSTFAWLMAYKMGKPDRVYFNFYRTQRHIQQNHTKSFRNYIDEAWGNDFFYPGWTPLRVNGNETVVETTIRDVDIPLYENPFKEETLDRIVTL